MIAEEKSRSRLTGFLERCPGPVFVAYAVLAAFSTYFCMYAFRKPFSAAKFEGLTFLGSGVELKTALVTSQIIGYALSKLIGIKICSEMTRGRRAWTLIGLIVCAEAALVLFGVLPDQLKPVAIFFNGLPLGMVWGLVVWYLEGRRTSELLLMGLSCSFIVSSGIVKDFGRALMQGGIGDWWAWLPFVGPSLKGWLAHVSEGWMPAVTGLHFLPLFFLSVWLLNQLPQPSSKDVQARTQREPMDSSQRFAFAKRFAFGLACLCLAYFFLTAYRDFRDNYQVEILDGLGYSYKDNRSIISQTETLVAVGVLIALSLLFLVRDNRLGLAGAMGIMTSGFLLIGASTLLLDAGMINGFWWMTLTGLGSYLAYVPYGSVLFDRLIASTNAAGTAVFAIYLADTIGYTGSVAVQLLKDLGWGGVSRLAFFRQFSYCVSLLGVACLLTSMVYLLRKLKLADKASLKEGTCLQP